MTAALAVNGAAEAIEFYKKAFGAEEVMRAPDPSGKKIWHASIAIGNSQVFVNDTFPEMGGTANKSRLWIYVENVDALFKRATGAGATVKMPLGDMFWGDRIGCARQQVGERVEPRSAHEGHDSRRDEEGARRLRRRHEEVNRTP